ncbi:MAG: NAD(P)-dependent oxidoreductase [Nitrososphaerales archaeon]
MTILITGGGLVGSHVAKELVEDLGMEVFLYDVFPNTIHFLQKYMGTKVKMVIGDIRDLPKLIETIRSYKVDKIVHTAALIDYKYINENPYTAFDINVKGTLNVLEASRILNVKRIVYTSSGSVYGKAKAPAHEDTPINPDDMYGMSKALSELLGLQYAKSYGIDFRCTRLYFIYGEGMYYREKKDLLEPPVNPLHIVYTMLLSAIRGVSFRIDKGADDELDYTYVMDSAHGVILALMKDKVSHRVFNISNGKAYTLIDVSNAIKRFIPQAHIEIGKGKIEGWPPRPSFLSIERAKAELGYEPKYGLEEGIKDFYKRIKDRV